MGSLRKCSLGEIVELGRVTVQDLIVAVATVLGTAVAVAALALAIAERRARTRPEAAKGQAMPLGQVDEETLRVRRATAERVLPDDPLDKRGSVVGWPQTTSADPYPERLQFDEQGRPVGWREVGPATPTPEPLSNRGSDATGLPPPTRPRPKGSVVSATDVAGPGVDPEALAVAWRGVLVYLFGFVGGLIGLLSRRRAVRFHAVQSLGIDVATLLWILAYAVLGAIYMAIRYPDLQVLPNDDPLLVTAVFGVFGLELLLRLWCIVQVVRGKQARLPVLSRLAVTWSMRGGGRPPVQPPYIHSNIIREIGTGGTELAALFFKPIDHIPPPTFFEPDQSRIDEFTRFLHSHGATDPNATMVRVVVQGPSEHALVLTGLSIRIVERRRTVGGILIVFAGGGVMDVRSLHVDLDSPTPIASPMPNDLGERWSFPLQVSSSDPEVLVISAETHEYDCLWFAELNYVVAGRAGIVKIDDSGKPFRTTTPKEAKIYQVSPDGKSYIESGWMP